MARGIPSEPCEQAVAMYAVIKAAGPEGLTVTEIRQRMGWEYCSKVFTVAMMCETHGQLIGMDNSTGHRNDTKWYTFPIEGLDMV